MAKMFKLVSAKRDLFPNLPIPHKQLKCYAVLMFLFCQQNSESVESGSGQLSSVKCTNLFVSLVF
jgi:hypothetical protein